MAIYPGIIDKNYMELLKETTYTMIKERFDGYQIWSAYLKIKPNQLIVKNRFTPIRYWIKVAWGCRLVYLFQNKPGWERKSEWVNITFCISWQYQYHMTIYRRNLCSTLIEWLQWFLILHSTIDSITYTIPLNRAGDCSYAQYSLDDKYSIRPGFEPSTLNHNLTKWAIGAGHVGAETLHILNLKLGWWNE